MITIKPITAVQIQDRFATSPGGGKIPNSSWRGDARCLLPLTEPVPLREPLCVFNGYTLDGKVSLFSARQRDANPAGWSIQVMAPPTICNLWAVSGELTRLKIQHGHEYAAFSCLDELERSFLDHKADLPTYQTRGVLMAVVQQDHAMQRVPQLVTEAYMPNLYLDLKGAARRCPLHADRLDIKADALTEIYRKRLCEWFTETMGLDFIHGQSGEPVIVGVPKSLAFTETAADKTPRSLATLLRSSESLKFDDWQRQAARQGWGRAEGEALVNRSAKRVSLIATLERAASPKHETVTTATNLSEALEERLRKHIQEQAVRMSM